MSSANPPTYLEAIKLDPICHKIEEDHSLPSPSAPLLPPDSRAQLLYNLNEYLRGLPQTLKFTTGTGATPFFVRDSADCLTLKGELRSLQDEILLNVSDVTNRSLFSIKMTDPGQGNYPRSKFAVSHLGTVLEIIEMSELDPSSIRIKDNMEYLVTCHGGLYHDIAVTRRQNNFVLTRIHIPYSATPGTAFDATMVFPIVTETNGLEKCLSLAVPMIYMLQRSKGIHTQAQRAKMRKDVKRKFSLICVGLVSVLMFGSIIWMLRVG